MRCSAPSALLPGAFNPAPDLASASCLAPHVSIGDQRLGQKRLGTLLRCMPPPVVSPAIREICVVCHQRRANREDSARNRLGMLGRVPMRPVATHVWYTIRITSNFGRSPPQLLSNTSGSRRPRFGGSLAESCRVLPDAARHQPSSGATSNSLGSTRLPTLTPRNVLHPVAARAHQACLSPPPNNSERRRDIEDLNEMVAPGGKVRCVERKTPRFLGLRAASERQGREPSIRAFQQNLWFARMCTKCCARRSCACMHNSR